MLPVYVCFSIGPLRPSRFGSLAATGRSSHAHSPGPGSAALAPWAAARKLRSSPPSGVVLPGPGSMLASKRQTSKRPPPAPVLALAALAVLPLPPTAALPVVLIGLAGLLAAATLVLQAARSFARRPVSLLTKPCRVAHEIQAGVEVSLRVVIPAPGPAEPATKAVALIDGIHRRPLVALADADGCEVSGWPIASSSCSSTR